ncbi:hypothetical protein ABVT39_011327 [Epinephelus coioides]
MYDKDLTHVDYQECWDAVINKKPCLITSEDMFLGPEGVAVAIRLPEELSGWFQVPNSTLYVTLLVAEGYESHHLGPMVKRALQVQEWMPTKNKYIHISKDKQFIRVSAKVGDEAVAENDVGPLSSYSPTSPPPKAPLPETDPEPQSEGHLKVKALSHETRVLLEREYEVCPELVENLLRCLSDEAPNKQRHLEVMTDLRTRLHPVPPGPYRPLVRSYPLELRRRLRRIWAGTYTIRKAENKWLQEEHMRRNEQEILSQCNEVLELTQARDNLQQQLANYQELRQAIELLRDQVASYRRLRMTGTSVYVSDGQ